MRFMTAASVKNLPAYMDQNRQITEDRRTRKKEDEEKQMKEHMRELGQKFMAAGDYTPEGLKTFAEENQMSMAEMKGMTDMVIAFKKISSADPGWVKQPEGEERWEDRIPGKTTQPGKTTSGWITKDGKKVWGKLEEGTTSELTGTDRSDKVSDAMKTGNSAIKTALGFSTDSGWPDPAAQRRYTTAAAELSRRREELKDPSDVHMLVNDILTKQTTQEGVNKLLDDIPENATFARVSTAKEHALKALEAGVEAADVAEVLKAKGWTEEHITEILGDAMPVQRDVSLAPQSAPVNNPMGL